jgi:hypothetical protein
MDRQASDESVHSGAARLERAREFVAATRLPPAPSSGGLETLGTGSDFAFDRGRDQAAIVGSDVVSFVRGVTEDKRRAIVSASLLAQLVAKQQVQDSERIYEWYDAYLDVLSNLGWVLQDRGFADYAEVQDGFEAHEAILGVATVLLGAAPAALAVVKATLDSLKSMSKDSAWITLFNRESRTAKAARFQVSLAEEAADGQFLVTIMAFGLEAKSDITQVLFFKIRSSEARLRHLSSKVTIDMQTLAGVQTEIDARVAAFRRDYIRGLPQLSPSHP